MRTVGVEELGHLPFVRHQVDPARVVGAWTSGDATAVHDRRRTVAGDVMVVTCLGDRDAAALLTDLAGQSPTPDRVAVTGPVTAIPSVWAPSSVRQWHWMLTTRTQQQPAVAVETVADSAEVDELLDLAAPDSHVRPGTPGVVAWLGIRAGHRLVATGAVLRQHDGTGHVRGVAVAPDHRGSGLGREISRALTNAAMRDSGVCSLGVYADNEVAIRTYRSLGYEVVHTFTSGPVSGSSITTADAPSR